MAQLIVLGPHVTHIYQCFVVVTMTMTLIQIRCAANAVVELKD